AGSAAAFAVAVATAAYLLKFGRPGDAATQATHAAVPIDAPPAASAEVLVRVTPPSAQIFVDGVAVGSGSYRGRVPKTSDLHQIPATAEGFVTQAQMTAFDRDLTVVIALEASAEPAPPPASTPSPSAAPARKASAAPQAKGTAEPPTDKPPLKM